MPNAPSDSVLEAFIASSSHLERRVEIYEFDGTTPWKPHLWDSILESGSVNVTYDSEERRNFDVVLDNYDGELDHRPGNLWYDKVFKVFYGIHINQKARQPSIVIIEEFNLPGQAVHLKNRLTAAGFTRVRVNTEASSAASFSGFDIVVSLSSDYAHKLALLQEAYNAGKSVLTFNLTATQGQLPLIIGAADAGTVVAAADHTIRANAAVAHPVQTGWSAFTQPGTPSTYRKITATASGAVQVGQWVDATNGTSAAIIARAEPAGARWVHVQHGQFDPAVMGDISTIALNGLVGAAVSWLDTFEPIEYWETQIGELVPEQISVGGDNEDLIGITGKDYTKRCMSSKLATAITYTAGTSIKGIIEANAANAKCFKTSIPPITATLPKDITYESDTERWKIMKELADAAGYEIFFDAMGQLTMRPYQDPLLTPATLTLSSGTFGNLVSRSSTASDTSLKNIIVVRGESSDSTVLPVWAQARNNKPSSPAAVDKIGERMESFTSALYTTTAQCQQMADNLLRVSSLEEFSMDFSAILFPWVECGEIVELSADDSYSQIGEPQRFLISSLSLPLDLGPMTGTGKRVTIVV